MSSTKADVDSITPPPRCWVEIDLDRIAANVSAIRSIISPNCSIIAVVKANAYGHGMIPVARALHDNGVHHFAIATVEEAIELRQALPNPEILVLEGFHEANTAAFEAFRLTATYSGNGPLPRSIPAHLKIDTGMTRQGICWRRSERIRDLIRNLGEQLTGVYSHFCTADDDQDFEMEQLKRFCEATRDCNLMRHVSSSYALPDEATHLDAVRPGLALYGLGPTTLRGLQPALRWKARLLDVKIVPAGSTVGYGRTYTTTKPNTTVGVVSVGYADGYFRSFSNNGYVQFRGQLASLIGRVSMDLTTIDLTDCPDAEVGDEVTLLDWSSDSPISAENLARRADTIPYEVLTTIGGRVKRMHTASCRSM